MKRITILIAVFFHTGILLAQKKPLDFAVVNHWPVIDNSYVRLSDDGKYVAYIVSPNLHEQSNYASSGNLIVQAVDGSLRREIPNIHDIPVFTSDNRKLIFATLSRDSVGILDLKANTFSWLGAISDPELPEEKHPDWLIYKHKASPYDLEFLNLVSGKTYHFKGIISYVFDPFGRTLIINQKNTSPDASSKQTLSQVDLQSGKTIGIGQYEDASGFVFDATGTAMAFLVTSGKGDKPANRLFYFKTGMKSAKALIDSNEQQKEGFSVNSIREFSKNGDRLFFQVEKAETGKPESVPPNSKVTLWSYQDDIRQDQADVPLGAAINIKSGKLTYLQKPGDKDFVPLGDGKLVYVNSTPAGGGGRSNLFLVSAETGERKLIKENLLVGSFYFSLSGKFITWFDLDEQQWFSCDVSSGTVKCISKPIQEPMINIVNEPIPATEQGVAGWLANDAAVLLYDRYDIWRVDPKGLEKPINLTRNYGSINHVRLRTLHEDYNQVFAQKNGLLICGFDLNTKYNRYYKLSLSGGAQLTELSKEDMLYYGASHPDFPTYAVSPQPVKARSADVYLLKGMSTTAFPNLYLTRDFKQFQQLTNYEPQKQYNWFTTELIHFPQSNGLTSEGILFKPEDFDPTKKYPVIFYYYEHNSDALHNYINPGLSNGCMNIPWFVSNGYLVFVPEIDYQDGEYKDGIIGEKACDAVVSAAKCLSALPYVDSKHMGIQGHSFGGFETDYIVSHSNLFAAAAPAAGMANVVSEYLGFNKQYYYENGQGRMGATLWQKPELYIENSAIFKADRVTTPVLILHNQNDGIVRFNQEEQWFNALKRSGKKVWMLSYDKERHVLEDEKNQLDYSIRLSQFFDHYLKRKPAPVWMTKGSLGYELDPGVEP